MSALAPLLGAKRTLLSIAIDGWQSTSAPTSSRGGQFDADDPKPALPTSQELMQAESELTERRFDWLDAA
jgi:hypothetical protein